jgi:hypothetical protein
MAAPTLTAQNTWTTNPGEDFLQLQGQGGGTVGWIDSTGAGQGALASVPPIIFKLTQNFTSAQILNLVGNPVNILPAPGVGFMYQIFNSLLLYKFNTTAYSNTGGAIQVAVSAGTLWISQNNAGFMDQTTNKFKLGGNALTGPTSTSFFDNASMNLINTNGSNLTLGDSTLELIIWYVIIPTK